MKNKEPINFWNIIKVAGAWISFCVGSGYVTGTGFVQCFGGHGKMAYVIVLMGFLMSVYFAITFIKLGFSGELSSPMDMFEYYCGPYLGKAFKYLTLIYMCMSPIVMIAGFGASFNQHTGAPVWVGSLIMGTLCMITVLLGLRKLVDIVGTIGPIIIVLVLILSSYYIYTNGSGIAEGMRISTQLDILKYNDSWFITGLMEAAWAPMILGPFLVACTSTIKNEREGIYGSILGAIGHYIGDAMLVTAFFCTFAEISKNQIPTLYMVTRISASFAPIFVMILFLGVYSSAVPSQFNFCSNFFPEKTMQYNLTAVISIFISTVIAFVIPFELLLNRVNVCFSYASWIFIACMILKQIRTLAGGKKSSLSSEG